MAERLAPGHLRLPFERRKWFSDRHLLLCFVIWYPYHLLCASIERANSQKKPDQHEMMSDGAAPKSDAWGPAQSKNLAVAGEIE